MDDTLNVRSAISHPKFQVGSFASHHVGSQTVKATTKREPPRQSLFMRFEHICDLYREQTQEQFAFVADQMIDTHLPAHRRLPSEAERFLELENKAMIGVPETVAAVMDQIQTYVDANGLHSIPFPDYYMGLRDVAPIEQHCYSEITHAMFHEIYGFRALACWRKYPDSYAAQIIGTTIWIHHGGKHERMPFQFGSVQDVDRMIRSLTRQKPDAVVNLYQTTLEIDLYTGERVTLTVKPDVKQDVITFRRFLIGRVEVADLADQRRKTIPIEAVPFFQALSKTHCNFLIVGPPGTGKSTTLKAMLAEREPYYTGAIIEKHYELAASRDFPEKKLIERITHESTFHHAMDQVLRFDVDYALIGEVRRVEAEGAMLACERLLKGFGSTYHTWRPETVPSQFARLLCALNPGARFEQEERRVAENIDVIFVQSQDITRTRKTISRVVELYVDGQNQQIVTTDLMRLEPLTGKWQYRSRPSETLVHQMQQFEPYWCQVLLDTLQRLASDSPIPAGEGMTRTYSQQEGKHVPVA